MANKTRIGGEKEGGGMLCTAPFGTAAGWIDIWLAQNTCKSKSAVLLSLMLPRAIMVLCFMWFQGDKPEVEVVVGPECITEMHASENTDCRGPDLQHLTCKRIVITYKPSCVHINVVPK